MSLEANNQNNGFGPVMLDLIGFSLSDQERQQLRNPLVGGVILFTRNYQSMPQLTELVKEIRTLAPNTIIAVDHEGGRVQRFKDGFTRIPAMQKLGDLYRGDRDAAIALSKDCGWLMAAELVALDIDISFAPILDRNHGISEIIGDRSFSDDPDAIVDLSAAFILGMKEAGMASTGKHFPGHGAVEADSHLEVPIDTRSEQTIKQQDMGIFTALIGQNMDAVMPAHVIYPAVDNQPAGFSPIWLQQILRQDLGFDGVIFSDDLGMEGATVAGSFSARAQAALDAGCDMVLVCNNPKGAEEVLGYLQSKHIPQNMRLKRMLMQSDKKLSTSQLRKAERWKNTNRQLSELVVKETTS